MTWSTDPLQIEENFLLIATHADTGTSSIHSNHNMDTHSTSSMTHISYIIKHRLIRERNSNDFAELRYFLLLDVVKGDEITRIGPVERTLEQLKADKVEKYEKTIEEYWSSHGIFPRCAREILATKDPADYKSLWGRLPYEEAAALFYLDQVQLLHLWKPFFTMEDVTRCHQSMIVQLVDMIGDLASEGSYDDECLECAPAYSPAYQPPGTPITPLGRRGDADIDLQQQAIDFVARMAATLGCSE